MKAVTTLRWSELLLIEPRMLGLCREFPTLPLMQKWEPKIIDCWANGPAATTGGRAAAQFVLELWDPTRSWKCGPFRCIRALQVWDGTHRGAYVAWATDPWFP